MIFRAPILSKLFGRRKKVSLCNLTFFKITIDFHRFLFFSPIFKWNNKHCHGIYLLAQNVGSIYACQRIIVVKLFQTLWKSLHCTPPSRVQQIHIQIQMCMCVVYNIFYFNLTYIFPTFFRLPSCLSHFVSLSFPLTLHLAVFTNKYRL